MINKENILKGYASAGKNALIKRQIAFNDLQQLGEIPSDLKYTDENYYNYIGKDFASLPSPEVANSYLVNVFNKLGRIDFKRIAGERNHLFNRALQDLVPAGDSIELMYTNLQETDTYDRDEFVPTKTQGGDLILSQRIRLSNLPKDKDNPDKRRVRAVVETQTILQALQPAISSGLSNGWPTIFDEQLTRSWDKFKFNRQRTLISMAGGTPSKDTWMDSDTTFTANDGSFVQVTKAITDEDTFKDFLTQVYTVSADLEAKYETKYNPASIDQITSLRQQGIYINSKYQAYWRNTNAILFNSEKIDIKNVYGSVDFLDLLPSKVKTEAKEIVAVLYADYPFLHYPFTNGVMRLVHMWPNITTSIYDNFWLASGIDLSKNIIVFYAPASGN
jgi:hypothetical protein